MKILLAVTCTCIGMGAVNPGRAADPKPEFIGIEVMLLEGDEARPKNIFVFLDGTGNDRRSGTNVRRLYDQLVAHRNPQTTAVYIEGVGSVGSPLKEDLGPVLGDVLGTGMQARILEGYDFIAKTYRPRDKIFIFGFSRGAHEARALAGFLSYAGLPASVAGRQHERKDKWERILALAKDKHDDDYLDRWKAWKREQPPLLAEDIRRDKEIGLDMQAAEVEFLGVWDTVPGSAFKDYGQCKEKIGFVKRYFHWLPLISKGERYKSGSYPPIRNMAHAVSADEKRSKFKPLLLCPRDLQDTTLNEAWFPGAHSDVGGGYDDSDGLPAISFNWMIGLLTRSYEFGRTPPKAAENPRGLAHWSIGDFPGNAGSVCEDREPPEQALHGSVLERKGEVPIRIGNAVERRKYPIRCADKPGPADL